LARVQIFRRRRNRDFAIATIHEQPFPLPYCYQIGDLHNVDSAAQISFLYSCCVHNRPSSDWPTGAIIIIIIIIIYPYHHRVSPFNNFRTHCTILDMLHTQYVIMRPLLFDTKDTEERLNAHLYQCYTRP
jgi:hypothetical protein